MDNPGIKTLAALTLGDAMAQSLLEPVTGLTGMTLVTLDADFRYGNGTGTPTAVAIVATSFDGGVTWRHIARFEFAAVNAVKKATIGLSPQSVAAYQDLAAEGVNQGALGDQLAVFLSTTGTYSGGTTLAIRANVVG